MMKDLHVHHKVITDSEYEQLISAHTMLKRDIDSVSQEAGHTVESIITHAMTIKPEMRTGCVTTTGTTKGTFSDNNTSTISSSNEVGSNNSNSSSSSICSSVSAAFFQYSSISDITQSISSHIYDISETLSEEVSEV